MKPVLLCLTRAWEALDTQTGAIPLHKHRVKNEVQHQKKKKKLNVLFLRCACYIKVLALTVINDCEYV